MKIFCDDQGKYCQLLKAAYIGKTGEDLVMYRSLDDGEVHMSSGNEFHDQFSPAWHYPLSTIPWPEADCGDDEDDDPPDFMETLQGARVALTAAEMLWKCGEYVRAQEALAEAKSQVSTIQLDKYLG